MPHARACGASAPTVRTSQSVQNSHHITATTTRSSIPTTTHLYTPFQALGLHISLGSLAHGRQITRHCAHVRLCGAYTRAQAAVAAAHVAERMVARPIKRGRQAPEVANAGALHAV
eukprot:365983-Chlamydomonas_euryale.AAC.9